MNISAGSVKIDVSHETKKQYLVMSFNEHRPGLARLTLGVEFFSH